jgi:hypothetical protein
MAAAIFYGLFNHEIWVGRDIVFSIWIVICYSEILRLFTGVYYFSGVLNLPGMNLSTGKNLFL